MLYNYTRGRFLENRRESDKVRKTVGCSLKDAKGVHDLYFVFKGEAGHDLFVWDWWRMK